MKKLLFFGLLIQLSLLSTYAQKVVVQGKVTAEGTGETLIGANIVFGSGLGTVSNIDGNFSYEVEKGKYTIQVSYVGFQKESRTIEISKNTTLNFSLKSMIIDEVSVVADVAIARETPVAFTNVLPAQIEEQLAGQDIPMVLNSTPGVYATQQGGGDGDARITIRGFSQRNVAVMLDGIPVNDMENGWVYWSNWFGLDQVTRTIQVQRGLGASKLALPSVGGTMNILTKSIESKRSFNLKQEFSSEGKSTTSFGYNSGKLPGNWGLTLAGSYKKGNGWVDETWSEAFFYFAKLDKRIGKHILSLTAYGAPQTHGQRSYKRAIATYDSAYAVDVAGIDTSILPQNVDMGVKYNQQWGYLERYQLIPTDSMQYGDLWIPTAYDTIHTSPEKLHLKENVYFKPMFSLRDFWSVSDKLYVSNILYLSIGNGGGTSTRNSLKDDNLNEDGQINWQQFYDIHQNPFAPGTLDSHYSLTEHKAGNYRVLQKNQHFWYGMLSTLNYKQSERLEFSGGLDLRSYRGTHYMEVYDLIGADYAVDLFDANQDTAVKKVGDKVYYYNDSWVKWGGLFGQIEYKAGSYSTFLNLSAAYTGFSQEDYFELPDSPLRNSGWLWKPSFTFKTGFNYNLSEKSNVFVNLGYLTKTRASNYIYNGYNAEFRDNTDNEIVKAAELGYTYASPVFALNLNTYLTNWVNRPMNPFSTKVGDQDAVGIIPGIDALHTGIEADFIYKILPNLEFQGLISLGNWTWTNYVENVILYDRNNYDIILDTTSFDARGVHISDAAQTQYGASVRYEPLKGLYITLQTTFFDRYYANMEPTSLNGSANATDENGDPKDSWQVPSYNLVDLHAGYRMRLNDQYNLTFRFSMLNIMDNIYISDAQNNDQYIYDLSPGTFDATSASVFFGLGRRFTASVKLSF